MATLVHLSTIHPRADARILIRQAQTLAARFPHTVVLMIADGQGHVPHVPGKVAVHDLGSFTGRLGRAIAGPWRALQAIRTLRPETVHFHDPELIPLGILLRLMGYMVIYDIHEDVPRQVLTKHWLPAPIRLPMSWVVSVVEWIAGHVLTALVPATQKIADRFPVEKTVTVQNLPVLKEMILAEPVPYRDRADAFVYPGVIADTRGAVEMVRALELLGRPSAHLHLAGQIYPAAFQKTLESMPGWQQVTYHGGVSRAQVAAMLGAARAGMVVHHPIPNEIDAQPIKTFEYMSAGLPVIASDYPAWRKIIGEVGCGLMVDPLDPQAIADAMAWILDHPAEAEAMGEKGRQAVATTYNWEAESGKLVALYERLLGDVRAG